MKGTSSLLAAVADLPLLGARSRKIENCLRKNLGTVAAPLQWPPFAQQFYNRHYHVDHWPGRSRNDKYENHHLLRAFTCRLDPKFTAQVVKIAEFRSVLVIVRRRI